MGLPLIAFVGVTAMTFLSRPFATGSRRITARVAALSAGVLLLAACTDDVPEVSGGGGNAAPDVAQSVEPAESEENTEQDESAEQDDSAEGGASAHTIRREDPNFPSCDVIERQVGTGLETLEFAQEEVHIAEGPMDSSHMTCMWMTEMYENLENADANTLMEAIHTGVLTMAINISPRPLAEEDAAAVGYAFHDLRAKRAGGYVFAPEDTDLSDPLGMMGITVSVDGVDVMWGGMTYFDGQGDQIAEQFDKDWGVEAGLTVHRLIWD